MLNHTHDGSFDEGYRAGLQRARDAGFTVTSRIDEILRMTGGLLESDYARGQLDLVATTFDLTPQEVKKRAIQRRDA